MKIFGIVALSVGAIVLSACGGGSSHATCKDQASTTAYLKQFTDDMMAAATAGKIDPAKAQELQTDMMKIGDGVKEGDYGAICVKLDDLKKKYGI